MSSQNVIRITNYQSREVNHLEDIFRCWTNVRINSKNKKKIRLEVIPK